MAINYQVQCIVDVYEYRQLIEKPAAKVETSSTKRKCVKLHSLFEYKYFMSLAVSRLFYKIIGVNCDFFNFDK